MVCPKCHGAVLDGGERAYPCSECQGSGIVSCCDTAGTGFPIIKCRLHDDDEAGVITGTDEHIDLPQYFSSNAEENWQDWVNSQLAGTTRKDETALYARIVELEKRVGELEQK